jgi:hypothetical protein
MSHIDRLSVISRILLDERVIDLRKEVERLKLEVFWRDYGLFRLNQAMGLANYNQTKCTCYLCGLSGRTRLMEDANQIEINEADSVEQCKFVPWLDAHLSQQEFLVSKADKNTPHHCHVTPIASGPLTRNDCMDSDCHFIKLGVHGSWYAFGEKLWRAKSTKDPGLRKLKFLIEMLESTDSDDDPGYHAEDD